MFDSPVSFLNRFIVDNNIVNPSFIPKLKQVLISNYDNAHPYFFNSNIKLKTKTVIRSNNNLNMQATYF
jgi:DNA-directed RNA polymerase subunit L